MPGSVELTTRKRTLGLVTGLVAGIGGGTLGAFLALKALSLIGVESTAMGSPGGFSALGIAFLIAGLAVGFGIGLLAWAWGSTRLGWLTWEEIEALVIHGRK